MRMFSQLEVRRTPNCGLVASASRYHTVPCAFLINFSR